MHGRCKADDDMATVSDVLPLPIAYGHVLTSIHKKSPTSGPRYLLIFHANHYILILVCQNIQLYCLSTNVNIYVVTKIKPLVYELFRSGYPTCCGGSNGDSGTMHPKCQTRFLFCKNITDFTKIGRLLRF